MAITLLMTSDCVSKPMVKADAGSAGLEERKARP
jgi:hypothetical protein